MRSLGRVQQSRQHVGRGTGAKHEAEPDICREFPVTKLRESRHIRQETRPCAAGDGDGVELALLDQRERGLHLREAEQDVSGHEVGCLKAGPFGRHVDEIEAEALIELESEKMRWCADAIG